MGTPSFSAKNAPSVSLSPELSGEAGQAMPAGEASADLTNNSLVSRGLPRHDDGHPFRRMSVGWLVRYTALARVRVVV